MFKFLKEKLKGAISKISKKVGEEKPAEEPIKEKPIEQIVEPIKKEKTVQKEFQEKEEPGQDEDFSEDTGLDEELEDLEKLSSAAKAKKEETSSYQPLSDGFEEESFEENKSDGETGAESPEELSLEVIDIPPEEKYVEKPELAEQENEELPEEDEPETGHIPEKAIEEKKKRGFLGLFRKKTATEGKLPPKDKGETETQEQPNEGKKGLFGKFAEKITTTKISQEKFESLFSELEIILMENNVAMEVIGKIKKDLSANLVEKPIKRTRVEEIIKESLRKSIEDLFNVDKISLIKNIRSKGEKPFVIAFFGINGSGKTTSIAKVASMLKQNKLSVVLAAADTFRAASI